MESQVFSGARTLFKLGQTAVGYGLGVTGNTGINYQPLNILGHLEVIEHVPVAYVVEMSANLARLANFSRLAKGVNFPGLRGDIDGNVDSPQIMPAFGNDGLSILESGELQASIIDVVLGISLYTIAGVKCSQKSWDVTAAGSVAENCNFVARIMTEGGQSDTAIGN